ncbi:MAG TPA: hypothetical protein P5071_01930 [Paludibacteraceae bacterium]|nr:hypothetical protein [Paludibacteraceae bacterium]
MHVQAVAKTLVKEVVMEDAQELVMVAVLEVADVLVVMVVIVVVAEVVEVLVLYHVKTLVRDIVLDVIVGNKNGNSKATRTLAKWNCKRNYFYCN